MGTTARRVVRERIDPRLTAALFANDRTPIDAVLELVDNAVESREATVPEFERKVNELMLVSLTLAEARRGSRKQRGTSAGRSRQAGIWR